MKLHFHTHVKRVTQARWCRICKLLIYHINIIQIQHKYELLNRRTDNCVTRRRADATGSHAMVLAMCRWQPSRSVSMECSLTATLVERHESFVLSLSLLLVERAFSFVVADVARVVGEFLPAGDALALAVGVEPLLVAARVLGGVRHLPHVASFRGFLKIVVKW